MSKYFKSRLDMYEAVKLHCTNNSSIVSTSAIFSEPLGRFEINIGKIDVLDTVVQQKQTGVAIDKKSVRVSLTEDVTNASTIVVGIFEKAGNNKIIEAVKCTKSEIDRLSQRDFVTKCRNIHDVIVENLASLAGTKVTAPRMEAIA